MSTNKKIRVLTRIAFGFESPQALIALAMLSLGGHRPQCRGEPPTDESGDPLIPGVGRHAARTSQLGATARRRPNGPGSEGVCLLGAKRRLLSRVRHAPPLAPRARSGDFRPPAGWKGVPGASQQAERFGRWRPPDWQASSAAASVAAQPGRAVGHLRDQLMG